MQGGSRRVDRRFAFALAAREAKLVDQGVTCERCGASCEPDATVCFSCGAPIGELEQPTQPVRVPAHLRAGRASASSQEESTGEAEGAPRAPAPPADAAIPTATTTTTWPQRWRRRQIIRTLELAFIVLLVAAMGTGVVVLHYRLIPDGVPAQTLYRDPAHRFHFVQPALWQALPNADGVTLGDSTGTNSVQIAAIYPQSTKQTAAYYAHETGARLGLSTGIPIEVAGATWEEQAGQVMATDNVTRQIVVLVTTYNGELFIIQYSSPVTSFSIANDVTFQPLLRSFAFG